MGIVALVVGFGFLGVSLAGVLRQPVDSGRGGDALP
jgi:hypothetical protein